MNGEEKSNYVYVVRCADGTLYTGWTNDLQNRIDTHNSGKGAKYTRSRLPVALVYFEECESEGAARSREWHLKRLTRAQKELLIEESEHGKRKEKDKER